MNNIPIFFSFDDNYAAQAAVTFESLLTNACEDAFFELFIVHSGITKENMAKLHTQVKRHNNASLFCIDITGRFNFDFSDEFFTKKSSASIFTIETLYRCIPMLLSEFDRFDKIIYSDVDIVVTEDISDLNDIDVSNSYIAGVHIPAFLSHQVNHLPESVQKNYIAGGLWVMNLKKMRDDNISEKVLNIIEKPPCKLLWPDQDVLNLACSPNISFISYRYISIPSWLPLLESMNFNDENYPNKELYDAMYRPKIVHYAASKPWNNSNRPLKSDLWYYWLSKTEFRGKFIEHSRSNAKYMAYLFEFIPLIFSKVKVTEHKIKIKLLKIIPFITIKKKYNK